MKLPFSGHVVQDLGSCARVFSGEGEFFGEDAYAQFRRLAEVFNEGGAGLLSHPLWPSVSAVFQKLSLLEEPGKLRSLFLPLCRIQRRRHGAKSVGSRDENAGRRLHRRRGRQHRQGRTQNRHKLGSAYALKPGDQKSEPDLRRADPQNGVKL